MTVILRRILYCLPFLQLFLFMLLPFYQQPVADDFAGFYIPSKIGIAGAIRSYLQNGTGRYFVVTVFILICSCRFLLDHYFIVPLLFFVITYANLFCFIREAGRICFTQKLRSVQLHWLTASCIVLFLTSVQEVSTFFIWVTTCCIFLLSFNVLIFYTRWLLHYNFMEDKKPAKWLYALLVVCIFLLCGCEETTLYFSIIITAYILYSRSEGNFFKILKDFTALLLVLQFACTAIVFLMPGNQMRAHGFSPAQPVYFSLYSAFYQTIYIFFRILVNPVAWFAGIGCVLSFPLLKEKFKRKGLAVKTSYLFYLALTVAAAYFLCFFIRHFGSRVLPEYANNLVICYIILILLTLVLSKSYSFNTVASRIHPAGIAGKQARNIIYLSCICVFIFSDFTAGLIQSLATAGVHDTVLNERKNKIAAAKAAGISVVTFDDYQVACERILTDRYGKRVALFIKKGFHFPPQYIYTRHGARIDYSYAAYYGIDTIYTDGKRVISWDKAGIPLWNVKLTKE